MQSEVLSPDHVERAALRVIADKGADAASFADARIIQRREHDDRQSVEIWTAVRNRIAELTTG